MTRQPRPVTRGPKDVPRLMLAEEALFGAKLHTAMCHTDRCFGVPESRWCDSAEWDAQNCDRHLAAVDGPRSVRTRARRLARRLKRVTSRLAGGAQ